MRKAMRNSLAVALISALICAAAPMAFAADGDISVTVDGKAVVWTNETGTPFIDANKRTLVPLRAVADALGLKVAWDNEARQATFTKTYKADAADAVYLEDKSAYNSKTELVFTIDSASAVGYVCYTAVSGGKESVKEVPVKMDTAAIIKGSRTYAPVRYLAEAFGSKVTWNGDAQTVIITTEVPEAVQKVANSVQEMAARVAADLKGEWGDKHTALMASGKGSEYKDFAAMKKTLDKWRTDLGAHYVYCLVPGGENNAYRITVDGSVEPDDFGTEYDWEIQFDEAWAGKPASARSAWDDGENDLVWSGFAPVLDSKGNVAAIAGVDFPCPEILDYPQWNRDSGEWNHIED